MVEISDSKSVLAYKCVDNVTAIWFLYNSKEWIVDPCVLFNGLLGSVEDPSTSLLYLNVDNLSHRRATYYVKQKHDSDFIFWSINKLLCDPECKLRFGVKDFLKTAEELINCLCRDVDSKTATAYDNIINPKEITKIVTQLKTLKLFLMPQSLRSSEINKELLTFNCPTFDKDERDWAYDIPYILRIGNREIKSFISDWTNDMDYVRHQLESYCYCRQAQIKLYFEDEPTIINLKKVSALASTKSIGSGIAYNYDDYLKVEIQPNSFIKGSAIYGFCNERQAIKELYEGLLNVGRVGYEFKDYDFDNPWGYDAMVFYNHIKSPIIERYISRIKEDYNSIVERQRIIHHVFTISPDYTDVLGQMTGQSIPTSVSFDDVVTLYKEDDSEEVLCSVTLPGVYEWLKEFNRLSDGVNSTMGNLDVEKWHHRGLVLAKELKKKLPDDIDVWYGYPFDDVEHRDCRPILITDGTLKEYFEEELSKACFKKDKERIDYCLSMNADTNANDGAAFKHLIASEESVESITPEQIIIINKEKLELFEYLLTKGLIVNHGKGGIDPVLELCKKWKCDLIENRIHEIMNSI